VCVIKGTAIDYEMKGLFGGWAKCGERQVSMTVSKPFVIVEEAGERHEH